MGTLEGKVAFITGAARGQGRSHALRLAREGADIIAVDLCGPVDSVTDFYPPATPEDLKETVRQVEALDRRIVAMEADVRDIEALTAAVNQGVAQLGRLDIVVANAGIFTFGPDTHKVDEQSWQDLMDINVTGVWHTYKAAAEHLIASGAGGSVVIISSLAGFKGLANVAAYTTTKHAVVGLMKSLANELGPLGIRVNTIHPNSVDTLMVKNRKTYQLFRPELDDPQAADAEAAFAGTNPMGKAWIEPEHVSNAVAWLASDQSFYVTGGQIPVDAGGAVR
ncbi:mycofactocin-coupled SDR family oxidoreductase [Arthrobacter sp. zg-Y820]|uniref:mycofactocin-coupled SDR family oxidoreductase n=1 Tax=unclassified Arthrobacter TaxID=235627 RepID=UPI001E4C51A4|nr:MULTISPECIES: mycofactocin-coupled SDR family oxidoreductase [unclassified Arthrobacter]MCC9196869.1 mycofactocin-coupled SDR family oxidoreductase [Arthrobacter sp. zg-Y820]MDK1279733.1 mycofactocin-coupled SDR family oxidoreductase [Arthrobacter sp. zg.Y820]WIB11009.1 mycofactocin-coupled SDR family oxidoreductase [Arthrobacter sp. zg-Y820]